MRLIKSILLSGGICAFIAGCATVDAPAERVLETEVQAAAISQTAVLPEAPRLKRKLAVVRFSNSTRYGKGLLYDGENDPLADQAQDMLIKRLVETGQFLVFERDLEALAIEGAAAAEKRAENLVGVDSVVIGSVTEFGRKTEGQSGFLSSTKKQVVSATVEARLVDPKTGLAIFSARGNGEAITESGEVAGFGSRADYDATLNDKAIASAVSNLTSNIVSDLADRSWSTDVLQVEGGNVFISGGPSQGLKIGDQFVVETVGKTMKSGQTGLPITLPGEQIATLEVQSFFGDTEYTEGAVATIKTGSVTGHDTGKLIVREAK